jgi:hypothetical protein
MKKNYSAPIAELIEAEMDDLLAGVSFEVDIPDPGVDPIGGGGDEYVEGKSAVFDGGDSE